MMKSQLLTQSSVIAVLCTLFSASTALASGDKGHGGRGTVCFGKYDPQLKRRQVLSATLQDFDEAKLGTWVMDLGVDHPGVDDTPAMIQVAIDRLMKRDAYRAKLVAARAEEVLTTWHGLDIDADKFEIAQIAGNNSLLETSAEGCFPKQLAFNKVKPGYREYKYAYVKQFVQALPDAHRAGLVLHEALYNLEAAKGAADSDGVRKQVLAMSSRQFPEMAIADYWEFIEANSLFPSVTAENGSFTGTRRNCTVDCSLLFDGEGVEAGYALEAMTYPAAAIAEIRAGANTYRRLDLPVKLAAHERVSFVRIGEELLPRNGTLHGIGFTAEVSTITIDQNGDYSRFPCTPTHVRISGTYPGSVFCSGFDAQTGRTHAANVSVELSVRAALEFPQGVASILYQGDDHSVRTWFRVLFDRTGYASQTQLIKQDSNSKVKATVIDAAKMRTESEHRLKNLQRIYWNSEAGTVLRTTYSKESVETSRNDLPANFDQE